VAENTVSAGVREEQATERVREKARGWIAAILIGALVVIVVGTFVYVIWMSARIAEMTTDDLISVLQSIGTTLLAPLIGVIGAVIGFLLWWSAGCSRRPFGYSGSHSRRPAKYTGWGPDNPGCYPGSSRSGRSNAAKRAGDAVRGLIWP
jgi:hypothetical protein